MLPSKLIDAVEVLCQEKGLNESEVQLKRSQYGYNEISVKQSGSFTGILKRMWGPIPWLLEAAMIFELLMGKSIQAMVVFLLLVFSAVIGEFQEKRAKKAIGYLRQQLQINVRTKRNGSWEMIPARELLPEDIVHVGVGDIVPADLKVINGVASVNEAALTGESIDITKGAGETIFSASNISRGEVIAKVLAIGSKSSYGKTAELIRRAEAPGRLQVLLFNIVRYLAYLDVALAIILVVAALFQGIPWQELLPFLVILFIATIPISMPSSFTVANSLEAKCLAQEHVLVTGLTGIQEAASMNILLVDKTGTLTNNRPEIAEIVSLGTLTHIELLKLAAAASDNLATDSISMAIFNACNKEKLTLLEPLSFTAFDPAQKVSRALVTFNNKLINVVLGSPMIIEKLAKTPENFKSHVDVLSLKGSRVLALASGEGDNLVLQGLIAFADSPRYDAKEAIKQIQKLGIRVMMLTGDTVGTAKAIASKVGIGNRIGTVEDALSNPLAFDGFAHVYPEDKYNITKALQELGLVVGMTGDGINDAPALKQADVGIAVSSATDVAKAAAKIVLTRPQLADITKVVNSGHRVYRRMMTWTITKLARTAELAALLTLGFVFTGFFPVSLSLIVFIIVMNDMVTLTLGADNAWPTKVPERWHLPQLAQIAAVFTIGWLALGLGLIGYYITIQKLGADSISSLMFLFLMYSAMATILMTRTRDSFWSFAPGKWVAAIVALNIIVASCMAVWGWVMVAIPIQSILALVLITTIAMFILDRIKVIYYQATGILGNKRH